MAYVSISKDLVNDVEHKIRNMKDKQITELDKPNSVMTVAVNDPLVMDLIWGRHLHLASMMPDEWCKQLDGITLKTVVTDDKGAAFSTTFNLTAQYAKFRVPMSEAGHYGGNITIQVPPDHPLLQESIAHTRQVRDINTHWRKIGTDVVTFMRSAKSLNEALKLWPALALYVPESYIKKVAEKKAKAEPAMSKAQEILAGIDTDNITAAAVASRMTTT